MSEMMLGKSSGHTDSLTGLLRVIRDPAAVEAHIKKISEAEATHQASLTKARDELSSKREELNKLQSKCDAREKVLNEKDRMLSAREETVKVNELALTVKQQNFTEFETKTSTNLSTRAAQIQKTESEQKNNQKRFDSWERELNEKAQVVGDRERAVKLAETEHLVRAAKLREALA